ncbi:hypothetical protein BH24BAC1_BH24BAC1_27220 [soil metagenome]
MNTSLFRGILLTNSCALYLLNPLLMPLLFGFTFGETEFFYYKMMGVKIEKKTDKKKISFLYFLIK